MFVHAVLVASHVMHESYLYVMRSEKKCLRHAMLGYWRGVTKQSDEVTSNDVTENRVTGKNFEGSKILKSFKNMLDRL